MLIFFNPKYYQNEIWSNISVLYEEYFFSCFWLNAGDWKLETSSRPFNGFIKLTTARSGHFQ